MTKIRSYSELRKLTTLQERYEYLRLGSGIGDTTFGHERYLNQRFYRSREWRQIRDHVIVRDEGNDLGIFGQEIHDRIHIHHMNPITPRDILESNGSILDPEFLITTTALTHNAIHFGDIELLPQEPIERQPGDTRLW